MPAICVCRLLAAVTLGGVGTQVAQTQLGLKTSASERPEPSDQKDPGLTFAFAALSRQGLAPGGQQGRTQHQRLHPITPTTCSKQCYHLQHVSAEHVTDVMCVVCRLQVVQPGCIHGGAALLAAWMCCVRCNGRTRGTGGARIALHKPTVCILRTHMHTHTHADTDTHARAYTCGACACGAVLQYTDFVH